VNRTIDNPRHTTVNLNLKTEIDHSLPVVLRERDGRRKNANGLWTFILVTGLAIVLLMVSAAVILQGRVNLVPVNAPNAIQGDEIGTLASQCTPNRIGATGGQLIISWAKSGDALFTRYEIYCRNYYDSFYGSSPVYTTTDINHCWCKISSYTNWQGSYVPIGTGETYYVKVRDIDAFGSADSINQLVGSASNPSVSLSNNIPSGIHIDWEHNYWGSGSPMNNYFIVWNQGIIWRSTTSSSGPWTVVYTSTYETEGTAGWTDSSATNPATTYYYYLEDDFDIERVSPFGVVDTAYDDSSVEHRIGYIPEFPQLVLPVVGLLMITLAATTTRNRRKNL